MYYAIYGTVNLVSCVFISQSDLALGLISCMLICTVAVSVTR